MNDSSYYQKKRKNEQKHIPKDEWYPDESLISVALMSLLVIGFIIVGIVFSQIDDNSEIDCESIGGEYKVVDRQFSGKVIVDVYGCVK